MEYAKELEAFINYMKNVRNRSEKTLQAYSQDLIEFFSTLGGKANIGEITHNDIEEIYIAKLVEKGNAPTSRARKIASIRSFYHWAFNNGFVERNPSRNIESPKIPYKEPKVMNIDDVKAVMDKVKNDSSRESKCESGRDAAILSLMFATGIRRAEITEIKLSDIDMEESSILIHGKGNKERTVYFNDSTKEILINYIEEGRMKLKPAETSEYLFVSKRATKIHVATINDIVNKYFKSAGIKGEGYTAHSTRKAFATTVYQNTKDLMTVQNLLGHSNPQTTMRYIGINSESKKKVAMSMNF